MRARGNEGGGEKVGKGEGETYLAPEGRQVYRRAGYTKYPLAPEGRHVGASVFSPRGATCL